jgi:acetylornithine/succinyldiaminopimelate/putrescine aminotransferase
MTSPFVPVSLSLADLLGDDYMAGVCAARAALSGESPPDLQALATERVDFFPDALQKRILALLPQVGSAVCAPVGIAHNGATTAEFAAHSHLEAAPLSAFGPYRVGQNGRLYLSSKSAHYHAPLGHSFPGYRLIDRARQLGLPNATHNNTRGAAVRLHEEELVRLAAGGEGRLCRVLNLQTGSLADEAALKLALARFYRVDGQAPEPKYAGRRPVILVLGDDEGALAANYHGTTMFTQFTRGMWPGLAARLAEDGLYEVRCVRPNCMEDLETVFREADSGSRKIAAFFHEFVMMNYGARLLDAAFVRRAYELCASHDVPTVDDEIQTCVWGEGLFAYKEYGVVPNMVVVGKGFPGGEYAGSRVLFDAEYDCLPQFGALVTNGQEELTALSYLITIRWAEANTAVTKRIGEHYEARLRQLAADNADAVASIEGSRHLSALGFHDLGQAQAFTAYLNRAGLDISVQTYKTSCPPTALTKLPLIASTELVDFVVDRMAAALQTVRN